MNVEILARPANTAAKVRLEADERCTAEGGSMIAMSADMRVETSVSQGGGARGVLKGMARTLGGESLFMNRYTAGPGGGELYLAPTLPGDMETVRLEAGRALNLQHGAFVAHGEGVDLSVSWGGLKKLFSGERMVWLKLIGRGIVVINAYGSLYSIDVNGQYVVDTGNLVAFEEGLDFSIGKAGKSWLSSFLGGEGLVCRFKGSGRVWCQTHADKPLGTSLAPYLVPKKS